MAVDTDKRWKGLLQDWATVSTFDNVDLECKHLTQQQIAILSSALTQYYWSTRWTNLSLSKSELHKLISDIENALLTTEELCGEAMPIDCEDIEDCIENSEIIQEIEDTQSTGYNAENATKAVNTGKNSSVLSQDIYTPESACDDSDKDKLWSSINGLIDFWHNRNLQLLGEFSNSIGLQDVINTLLSTQPIYAVLNSTIKSTFASWLIFQAKNAYQSQITTTVLYELKCDLFCEAVANGCNMTMQEAIEEIFSNGLTFELTGNIVDLYTELASFAGANAKEWFAAIASLQIVLATLGEKSVSTVGLQSFLAAAEAAAASPSNSWKAYCDACGGVTGWIAVLDFKGDYVSSDPNEIVYRAPFTIQPWGATSANSTHELVLGVGLRIVHPSASQACRREVLFAANTNIHDVEYRGYEIIAGAGVNIMNSSTFGWDVPPTVADSGIKGGGYAADSVEFIFGNYATTNWSMVLEWVKFRQQVGAELPPPKVI